MVRLTLTATMLDALDTCAKDELDSSWTGTELEELKLGDPISHAQIIALSNAIGVHTSPNPYALARLLKGSQVYVPPPVPKPKPSDEYKALMARLREEEEERQYDRMVKQPITAQTFGERFPNSSYAQLFPQVSRKEEDEEVTFADVNRQVTLIFNILISIVACAAAIWMATRYWPTPQRLGISMGGGGLVGVAEVVVYAGYLRRVSEAKQKEKKKVEMKQVIDTWVIEPKNKTETDVSETPEKLIEVVGSSESVRQRQSVWKNQT